MIARNKRYSFFLKFALLAFLVRSFIPIGFMPGEGGHGLAPLVICTGSGNATIFVPADKLPDPKAHAAHEGICGFSTAFAWGAMPVAAEITWAVEPSAGYLAVTSTALPRIDTKFYLSQGPPLLLQI